MDNKGFTLIEILIVTLLIGIVASVAIPRAFRTNPERLAYRSARELANDLEQVRTSAVSAKRTLRVKFATGQRFYTAFVDTTADRTGTIDENAGEIRASRLLVRGSSGGLSGVVLPEKIVFSAGSATVGPEGRPTGGVVVSGGVDYLEFNTRGLLVPLGTSAVAYVSHSEDPSAVAAVTISGAGSFQIWRWVDGKWVR